MQTATPDSIHETVLQLASETLDHDGPLPAGDLSEHLDSMDRLALVVAIEDHFEIAFDPSDEEEIRTLGDVVQTISTKLKQRALDA